MKMIEDFCKWLCSHETGLLCGTSTFLYTFPTYRLTLDMYAKTGGYKDIYDKNQINVLRKPFAGTLLSRPLHILFDVMPPTHCITDDSCPEEDLGRPVYVLPDVAKVHIT